MEECLGFLRRSQILPLLIIESSNMYCNFPLSQEMSKFQMAMTRHMSRTGNKVAHELAQYVKRFRELKSWFGMALEFISTSRKPTRYVGIYNYF